MKHCFTEEQRTGVYKAIYERRDMRHFIPGNIEPELLSKLLTAAHAAPSVGLMQPWRIIRITDANTRQALYHIVENERIATAEAMDERRDAFMKLKVEGVLDCSELLIIALCDRREKYIFGRRTLPEMDLASASCAIQNLWLAARAEGLGMGWVSLFEPGAVRQLLKMPEDSQPIAILCLGPVKEFYPEPMLQQEGWIASGDIDNVLMENSWQQEKAKKAHQR